MTPDKCIIPAQASFDLDGYPRKKWNRRIWRMNRLLWTWVYGDIPTGQVVAHRCNNKGCINTNHFYLTTPELNSTHAARDGVYKPATKYSQQDLINMWNLYHTEGLSQQAIADLYNTAQTTISSCLRRHAR